MTYCGVVVAVGSPGINVGVNVGGAIVAVPKGVEVCIGVFDSVGVTVSVAVSVDVGDVKSIVKDISGCIIAGYDSDEIAKNILKVIEMNKRATGRDTVESYSLENIAKKVYKIYTRVINNKKENK